MIRVHMVVTSEGILVGKLSVYLDPLRLSTGSAPSSAPLPLSHFLLKLPGGGVLPASEHLRDRGHLVVREEQGRHRVQQVLILLEVGF